MLKNEYASAASDGLLTDTSGYLDTGSYTLNALISGSIFKGIPGNKIVELCGLSSTGKTFFCLSVIKTFLEQNEDAVAYYFDSESATTSTFLGALEIPTDRLIVAPVATVEDFRNQAVEIVNHYNTLSKEERYPVLLVLDSLGNLSSDDELRKADERKTNVDVGAKAKLIKGAFRILTLKLAKANIPLLFTNHVYAKVGEMFPTSVVAGGSGPQYLASIIVELTRSKEKDKDNKVIGHIIKAKNIKNRESKENLVLETLIRYDTGINRYYGLVPIALVTGVFKKSSTFVVLPDGRKVYESEINKNPKKYYTEEILKEIDEKAQSLFNYGVNEETVQTQEGIEDDETTEI